MKKFRILFLALFSGCLSATAQNETKVTIEHNGKEDIINLPESMTYNTDSLLQEWKAQKYLYPDTTCENPDFNPTFEAEVYIDRLRRIPAVMEMPYNEIVQKFIDQYSGRLRRSVAFMLGAGNFYIPIFEEALNYYDIPLELKYLPVIESALNPTAVSRAGAVGLWQFMPATGKRYELDINSLIDERRDPMKSSFAAAKYLKDLYKMFGDWNLVIAAYNCGPSNVNKAINRADGTKDYWTIYPYLPHETRGYVPAFIAANYIMNYYCEHNICPMKTAHPITTDTIIVSQNIHMQQIAELCNVDIAAIKGLNPQYRTEVIPGTYKPCAIRLPQEAINKFISFKDSIYNYRADELFTRRSTVMVNEAADTRTKASSRSSSSSRSSKNARSKSKRSTKGKTVTVRNGDTLSSIAARNGTTVKNLRKLNGLKGNNIRAGKKLRVK